MSLFRTRSRALLVAAILPLPIWLWTCVALLPVFIRLLVPFPQLADVDVYSGSLSHQPSPDRYVRPSKYFIETKTGQHEFFCGYLMSRTSCPGLFNENGSYGTVWYSMLFGVIQYDLKSKSGDTLYLSRERKKWISIDQFFWSKYIVDIVLILVLSAFMASLLLKWREAVIAERAAG
jgi:hypothetical protein